MNSRDANVIIPPAAISDQTRRLVANSVLMAFGLLVFGLALIAGIKLINEFMFASDKKPADLVSLFAQVISLILLFFVGWVTGLVSIRFLQNRLYPYIFLLAGFGVSSGMAFIYLWGATKCLLENGLGLEKYAIVLFAGYLVLVAFSQLTEIANLYYMAAPLGFALVIHIFLMALHYLFYGAVDASFIFSDLGLMVTVLMLSGLMLWTAPNNPFQRPARSTPSLPNVRRLPGSQ